MDQKDPTHYYFYVEDRYEKNAVNQNGNSFKDNQVLNFFNINYLERKELLKFEV